jgi:hypothetical protein
LIDVFRKMSSFQLGRRQLVLGRRHRVGSVVSVTFFGRDPRGALCPEHVHLPGMRLPQRVQISIVPAVNSE